jgi:hypothetical protein
MEKKLAKIVLAILICAFLPAVSDGQLITIGIEATVNNLNDYYNLLGSNVHIGSTITGTYTYDTDTPDTNPSSGTGEYFHYTSPCGITLTLDDLVFSTDFSNVTFLVEIANVSSGFSDSCWIVSPNNISLYNGVKVDEIGWHLEDDTGTAVTSTALPTIAPVLSDWQYDNTLVIGGGIGGTAPCYDKTFYLEANVTSAVLIPEPISVLLFGFGLLTIRFHKR